MDVVRKILDALVQENREALWVHLDPKGFWMNPQIHANIPIIPHFSERIRRLDYTQLAGLPLLREHEVEVYTQEDLAVALPGRPEHFPDRKAGDILIRFRILTPRVGTERLFGEEVVVSLRPEGGAYRVWRWQEEFQLP